MTRDRQKGFTLIEVLITIVILGIISMIVAPLLAVSITAIGLHVDRVDIEESSNLALSRMTREIRRLRDDASVVTANATTFEFVDASSVQIRYRQTGNTLMRTQGANPESGLADNVQAATLAFTYYDDDGNTIAVPTVGLGTNTNIRRILIAMTFQSGTHTLPVSIQVQPRNLRHESNQFF